MHNPIGLLGFVALQYGAVRQGLVDSMLVKTAVDDRVETEMAEGRSHFGWRAVLLGTLTSNLVVVDVRTSYWLTKRDVLASAFSGASGLVTI